MGDFAEEAGIGRREPETVFNPQKPAQSRALSAVQDGVVHASFALVCYGMLGLGLLLLPKHQR